MNPEVSFVSQSPTHSFSKFNVPSINLLTGLGVEGDAHCGEKVKHRSRVAKNPDQPNLRQVHLIHSELFEELKEKGFDLKPGDIGENICTQGIDLLTLPKDTILNIGPLVKIRITGLRNPCYQLDWFKKGLMNAVLEEGEKGKLIRKSGIMGIVLEGGEINIGDGITTDLPKKPFIELERV